MTQQHDAHPLSVYDEVAATPEGARELAAAHGAVRVAQLLELAKDRSGITNRELAERLGVGESRVSQVLNGDGNLHVATVARFLHAMGYDLELSASARTDGVPLRARRRPASVSDAPRPAPLRDISDAEVRAA